MTKKAVAEEFINNSRPAIEHIFYALSAYNDALERAQVTVEEIEKSKQQLSDLFLYRDQWSPNANHHYAQYVARMKNLEDKKKEARDDEDERLAKALASIGATVESMSTLAGAVLQIAKQSLSLRYSGKPTISGAITIGSQSIIEVIWEGRNHAMHWDEGAPKKMVKDMLNALEVDFNTTVALGSNNCLSILGALDWKTAKNVESDLKALMQ
jgi:hypothetical protein